MAKTMKNVYMKMKQRSKILMFLLLIVILIETPIGLSVPEYVAPLQLVYGSGSCTTCHFSSDGGARNAYGTLFEIQPNHATDPVAALIAIGAPPGVTTTPTPTITTTPVPQPSSPVPDGPVVICYVIRVNASTATPTPTGTATPTPTGTATPTPTGTATPTPTPTPISNPSFKFIAWGDTKGGVNVLETESKSIVNKNPDFALYVGDICDSGPTLTCFFTWKNALNGDLIGATSNGLFDKTFAIRGNHDSSGGSVWQSEFNFNNIASSIGATNYVEQTLDMTYSFDYDNSHFVGIDNPCSNLESCAGDITSSQISWLDQDLTNAENRGLRHAFLFWHGPIYPVDGHCCGGASSAMIAVLNKHPIISAAFFGHEHVVEYTHLDSSVIPSLSCSFEQVITGGAGAGLYSLSSGRKVDYYLDQSKGQITFGYTMVGVSGDNFDISFYKTDGTLMNTLSFTETNTCQ